ncbi:hypothetical protein THTE_0461 [Thermogutta terrifontis]|uniref:Uncharacterized protein n=1 Tax=Thermogutta terrifontis TaxID=1331910 RepID=A0A286RAT5_9BACT|nr:hypothetical protein THTE_0461 [Thermogutta terrifontis]
MGSPRSPGPAVTADEKRISPEPQEGDYLFIGRKYRGKTR